MRANLKPIHSKRLERWLGTERIEVLSRKMNVDNL